MHTVYTYKYVVLAQPTHITRPQPMTHPQRSRYVSVTGEKLATKDVLLVAVQHQATVFDESGHCV